MGEQNEGIRSLWLGERWALRLDELARARGVSVSALLKAIVVAVVPALEDLPGETEQVPVTCTVRIPRSPD